MPLDGRQLDELLSGFIDGELTDEERQLVEKAARDDARIGKQIESLRQQSRWVWQVGQSQLSQAAAIEKHRLNVKHGLNVEHSVARSGHTLPRRLTAAAVVAEALRRGRELELPARHHLRLAADHKVHVPAPAANVASQRAMKKAGQRLEEWLALGGLAAAAAVLVAVTWPKLQQQGLPSVPSNHLAQRDDQRDDELGLQAHQSLVENRVDAIGSQEPAPAESSSSMAASLQPDSTAGLAKDEAGKVAGSSLVGIADGLAYALVVDVELSAQAEKSRVLEKLLTAAGIPLAPPVAVNAEILKALDDSRLVVRESTSTVHAVSIQVVRGGLQELDVALRKVWQDHDNFPNVGLNLSIDSRAALMREMLRSSGDRFAPTDRFAAPLAFDQEALAPFHGDVPAGRPSPLMADDTGVQYVSNSQRENGWESLGELSGTTPETLATILLVIHYAD